MVCPCNGREWLSPGWGTAGLVSSASACLPTSPRSLVVSAVSYWKYRGNLDFTGGTSSQYPPGNTFLSFFGGCYTIWFDWFRTERTSSALVSEQKIWIIWLQWLVPQIRSIAFGIGTYDLKIHAGNPQNILLLWLILQQNAPGYCAFRWRESPLSGMNALMDFNSKHKHEATPGRWKSASKVFQGVAVDIVIYEQMNWSPMVFHQSRVWGFAACANGVILPVRSSDGVVPGVSGLES